jgi:hypothetical protein
MIVCKSSPGRDSSACEEKSATEVPRIAKLAAWACSVVPLSRWETIAVSAAASPSAPGLNGSSPVAMAEDSTGWGAFAFRFVGFDSFHSSRPLAASKVGHEAARAALDAIGEAEHRGGRQQRIALEPAGQSAPVL